jgi:hypothetical protein
MKYLHIEFLVGIGLSEQDHKDYALCAYPKELLKDGKVSKSDILFGLSIKNRNTMNNLIFIDDLSGEAIPLHKHSATEQLEFSLAIDNDTFLSIGEVQEIPQDVFMALKDLFLTFQAIDINHFLREQLCQKQ